SRHIGPRHTANLIPLVEEELVRGIGNELGRVRLVHFPPETLRALQAGHVAGLGQARLRHRRHWSVPRAISSRATTPADDRAAARRRGRRAARRSRLWRGANRWRRTAGCRPPVGPRERRPSGRGALVVPRATAPATGATPVVQASSQSNEGPPRPWG